MTIWYRLSASLLLLVMITASAPSPCAAQLEQARRAGDKHEGEADERRLQALSRILMSQSRNVADLKVEDHSILLHSGKLDADSPDLESLERLAPGQVQELTGAASTKLRTEVDLDFGGTSVPAGNITPDHPGLYSVWLKRVEGGWHLVLNRESDVWGTQRDPSNDVEEIVLEYESVNEGSQQLTPGLLEGEGGGVLELRWGRHRWSAPFTVKS